MVRVPETMYRRYSLYTVLVTLCTIQLINNNKTFTNNLNSSLSTSITTFFEQDTLIILWSRFSLHIGNHTGNGSFFVVLVIFQWWAQQVNLLVSRVLISHFSIIQCIIEYPTDYPDINEETSFIFQTHTHTTHIAHQFLYYYCTSTLLSIPQTTTLCLRYP